MSIYTTRKATLLIPGKGTGPGTNHGNLGRAKLYCIALLFCLAEFLLSKRLLGWIMSFHAKCFSGLTSGCWNYEHKLGNLCHKLLYCCHLYVLYNEIYGTILFQMAFDLDVDASRAFPAWILYCKINVFLRLICWRMLDVTDDIPVALSYKGYGYDLYVIYSRTVDRGFISRIY